MFLFFSCWGQHTIGIEYRPAKPNQPLRRARHKAGPSRLHRLLKLKLRLGLGNSSEIGRISEDHIQVHAVVGSAGGIETGVVPISVVPESPGRGTGVDMVCSLLSRRAAKGLDIEEFPLRIGEIGTLCEGCDSVEAGFVVVMSEEIGLSQTSLGFIQPFPPLVLTRGANFPWFERAV
jgi:hypothetical protein